VVVAAFVGEASAAWVVLGAGAELEFAELVAGARGTREPVVLIAFEQMPEQHGQLAGDSHDKKFWGINPLKATGRPALRDSPRAGRS
jgi:hypothetical protein